ncbi:MAG TPA: HDOD domain-containing protein [Limnobacter sp.]|nr:HDOD domain-containing protein [Limnobacter sp.]
MSHLCGVLNLPALSVGAPKLLDRIQHEDLSLKELSEHLRLDPGIGARLLHIANSPFFGVSGQISSVEEALMMLGMRRARSFIQVEVLKGLVQTPPWNSIDLSVLWKRSLAMGAACQVLAEKAGFTDSDAFTAGLFHNLGCLVMLHQFPAEYPELLTSEAKGHTLLLEEQALFLTDHAEMGSAVLSEWNFPQDISKAAEAQYAAPGVEDALLQNILQIAHLLLDGQPQSAFIPTEVFRRLNLPAPQEPGFDVLVEDIQKATAELMNLLGD